jgi:signal transduction histidine kinase
MQSLPRSAMKWGSASSSDPIEQPAATTARSYPAAAKTLPERPATVTDDDLPEARQRESQLEALLLTCESLRAESRAKDEVLGLIAHELRNPLSALLAAGRRLALPAVVVPEEQETVAQLIASATRMAQLLENMLLLARGDQPELEPVLLQRLIPMIVKNHGTFFPERTLLLDLAPNLPVAQGHIEWIAQIMDNFLRNAEKYSHAATAITVSAVANEDHVSVRVLDRGHGILLEHAVELFMPFHREQATVALPGLGLGLTVCKRMVEMQGGEVWAAPRPDGGSEFGFSLKVMR